MRGRTIEKVEATGLIEFLKTSRSKDELKTALSVIQEFKDLETDVGFLQPFVHWTRLEQLEDYLRILTGEGADAVRDDIAKEYFSATRKSRPD